MEEYTPALPEAEAPDEGWLAGVRAGVVRPQRRMDVSETDLDDELILYDPVSGATHALNATAALVWEMCDGRTTLAGIAEELARIFTLSQEKAQDDVAALLMQLHELGLLDTVDAGGFPAP